MSITRPPVMDDEEAERYRARGGHIYQSSHDPRVSYYLNWIMGIFAAVLVAGGLAAFNTLLGMRDDVRDLKNRPAAATAEQVAYLQKQIDDIRGDITKERDRARQ